MNIVDSSVHSTRKASTASIEGNSSAAKSNPHNTEVTVGAVLPVVCATAIIVIVVSYLYKKKHAKTKISECTTKSEMKYTTEVFQNGLNHKMDKIEMMPVTETFTKLDVS